MIRIDPCHTALCHFAVYTALANSVVFGGDANAETSKRIRDLLAFADKQLEREDVVHALAAYTEVLKLDAQNTLALNGRGLARAQSDDIKGALADFDSLVKIDRRNPAAWTNRGAVYLQASNYAAAIADFTAAIKIDPKFSKAFRARAFAYKQTRQDAQASQDIKRAEQLEVFEDIERRWRAKVGNSDPTIDPTSE